MKFICFFFLSTCYSYLLLVPQKYERNALARFALSQSLLSTLLSSCPCYFPFNFFFFFFFAFACKVINIIGGEKKQQPTTNYIVLVFFISHSIFFFRFYFFYLLLTVLINYCCKKRNQNRNMCTCCKQWRVKRPLSGNTHSNVKNYRRK